MDAVIGGVLHLHLFIYVQMAHQRKSSEEIAGLFKAQLLSLDALKRFHDYVRCARYPDVAAFDAARDTIEKSWPAYVEEYSLCRAPPYAWETLRSCHPIHILNAESMEQWREAGEQWRRLRG